jgi:hypothetical protein
MNCNNHLNVNYLYTMHQIRPGRWTILSGSIHDKTGRFQMKMTFLGNCLVVSLRAWADYREPRRPAANRSPEWPLVRHNFGDKGWPFVVL